MIGTGTASGTHTIEEISNYDILIIQSMINNITLGSTTIFSDGYTQYGGVHNLYVSQGYVQVTFLSGTSVKIVTSVAGGWSFIYGVKLG